MENLVSSERCWKGQMGFNSVFNIENMQISAEECQGLLELNQNKPWFDKECLGFLDRRKRAKLQAGTHS